MSEDRREPMMVDEAPSMTREAFVAGALAAGAVAVLAGGEAFAETGEATPSERRWDAYGTQMGFWVELGKCVDCGTCAHKCNRANAKPEAEAPRRRIVEAVTGKGKAVFASMSCMHCLDPSCMAVCPAGAISKREKDGAVVVDHKKCIGCRYCFEACPFEVPRYNESGMYKCDFCIENGTYPDATPACAAACPHDALHFGSIEAMLAAHKGKIVPLTGITGPNVLLSL